MKKMIVVLFLFTTQIAWANNILDVTCSTSAGYKILVSGFTILDDNGSTHLSSYSIELQQGGSSLGRSTFKLLNQGYDERPLAFVWNFKSSYKNDVIALAVPNLQEAQPGIYNGSADILLELNGHTIDESVDSCEVTVE